MADAPKPGEQKTPETQQSFLNADERSQMQRFLGYPEEFPRKFGAWIADYISVNGLEIPASQIRGIQQFRPNIALVAQNLPVGATSYTAGGGPTLTDLGPGSYMLLYGFQFAENTGNNEGYALISPSVNGAVPTDGDAVRTRFLLGSDDALSSADKTSGSCIFFKNITLTEQTNTIEMKYRVTDGQITATNMFIIAIKISN